MNEEQAIWKASPTIATPITLRTWASSVRMTVTKEREIYCSFSQGGQQHSKEQGMSQVDRHSRGSGGAQHTCISGQEKYEAEQIEVHSVWMHSSIKIGDAAQVQPHERLARHRLRTAVRKEDGNEVLLWQCPLCDEGLPIVARRRQGAEKHLETPPRRSVASSKPHSSEENDRKGSIAHFDEAFMDFLQNEKVKEKDEFKLVAFCTRRVGERGQISLMRKSYGKCTSAANPVARSKRLPARKRRNVWTADQVKHLPPRPTTYEEWDEGKTRAAVKLMPSLTGP